MISVLKKYIKEDMLYWGTPVEDGYGGKSFTTPIELKSRWHEDITSQKMQNQSVPAGEQMMYSTYIDVLQELEIGGYVMRGVLTDLTDINVNPMTLENAHAILNKSKTPSLTVKEFWYKIYLK